ncbi:hypothetical protein [Demequina gelatinilytica]|uniref:hypothetical protein n=1 Tax=Demequina gelatinilytica TaxID=1638980 RepID=UPI0007858438|nr:hypothetical protein [Demequina gelatinilytica]
MKNFIKPMLAAVVGVALAVGTGPVALADSSPSIDRNEYAQIKRGMTLKQVKDIADSWGTVTSEFSTSLNRYQFREWAVTTSTSPVASADIDFVRKNGAWIVDEKSVWWTFDPKQTADKVTKSEFRSVSRNMPYWKVKRVFGTWGTKSYERSSEYGRTLSVLWPVPGSIWGDVEVDFEWRNGRWELEGKSAYWG